MKECSPDNIQCCVLLVGNIHFDGRVRKEIRSLRGRSIQVTLIQWPFYGERGNRDGFDFEIIDYPAALSRSALKNFYLQIAFNMFALKHIRKTRPDFVHCNDLNTLLAGALSCKNSEVLYDVHELFPESQQGPKKWIWNIIERLLINKCSYYLLPEKNRMAYFVKKYHLPEERAVLLENFPPRAHAFTDQNILRSKYAKGEEEKIILYTGTIGEGRDLESLIGAVKFLEKKYILILLGPSFKGYQEKLKEHTETEAVSERIFFHPPVENREMLDYIHCSDIGIVFYNNANINNYYPASNKLYEFILCRKPVLTNNYPGLLEVVEQTGAGVALETITSKSIAQGIRKIETGKIRISGTSRFTWEKQESNYLNLFARKSL
ncbi:glycosyltransferase [Fibrobacterota bacterium]